MKRKAFIAIICCGLLAGISGLFIKSMTSMSPGAIAFFRTAIPSIVLGCWILIKGMKVFRGNNKMMFSASFLNAIRMYLYLVAYIYTSIGNAVILFYTWPIFATILGVFWLNERVSRHQVILLGVAFAGLIISYSNKTFTFADKDLIGMLAAVGSALFYATTVVIFKSESQNYHRNETIFFQNLLGLFIFFPMFIQNYPNAAITHIGIAIIYALVIGVGIFGLFFYALQHLPATVTSSMMYLEVVGAITLGVIILGESFSLNMLIGGSMILISSFLINKVSKV